MPPLTIEAAKVSRTVQHALLIQSARSFPEPDPAVFMAVPLALADDVVEAGAALVLFDVEVALLGSGW